MTAWGLGNSKNEKAKRKSRTKPPTAVRMPAQISAFRSTGWSGTRSCHTATLSPGTTKRSRLTVYP